MALCNLRFDRREAADVTWPSSSYAGGFRHQDVNIVGLVFSLKTFGCFGDINDFALGRSRRR